MSKYSREELMANALTLFGVYPEAVAGALYGTVEDEFSIEEVKQLIEEFMTRRVEE